MSSADTLERLRVGIQASVDAIKAEERNRIADALEKEAELLLGDAAEMKTLDKDSHVEMHRVGFHTDAEDYRPINFPPSGPWWCSGYTGDGEESIIVAYVKSEKDLLKNWPEAKGYEFPDEKKPVTFSSRFERPSWWKK